MLLFSAILEINDTMTKDAFIELVLEWNRENPREENRIPDIQWKGERNIRYGTENLWLAIEEYRNRNIIAVRYEKRTEDGVIWDTDYVMNFTEGKLAVQLDRSYQGDMVGEVDPSFSTPHFITCLIKHGYLKPDGKLPVSREPVLITEENLEILTEAINGEADYRLPVVYVPKLYGDKDPVDVGRLAGRLKGVAHVLTEKTAWLDPKIRRICMDRNEFNGTIGVYFPKAAYGHKRYWYRTYEGVEKYLAERVIRSVIGYSNEQLMDRLYTWHGVNSTLLMDRLDSRGAELLAAEAENVRVTEAAERERKAAEAERMRVTAEADELIESVDEDIRRLKQQVADLARANEALTYENQGLRMKMSRTERTPVLFLGEEEEFYHDEIRGIVLELLKNAAAECSPRLRRKDILEDLIRNNECGNQPEERAEQLKSLLKGYKAMSGTVKRSLQDMGFVITDEGKHYKLTYYGDSRYKTSLAKTPSDNRSGLNTAADIIREMF